MPRRTMGTMLVFKKLGHPNFWFPIPQCQNIANVVEKIEGVHVSAF